ncbi:CRISP/Allergen/PR-1-like, partial [Penaeus monodon]|uniref:CRISP/Allergen/PR-1-like n=1 Tax=Penaeus monodon TaxID=6687 RepID=UPI0018A73230
MDLSRRPLKRVLLALLSLAGVVLAVAQDGGRTLQEEEREEEKGKVEGEQWVRPLKEGMWPRRYDGVFSCPCGSNDCFVGSGDKGGVSGPEIISSTCFLPSTDPGRTESGNIYKNETGFATEYCSFSPNHALCRYSVDKTGPACVKIWDEELSRIMQAWINQCIFQHDCGKCRETSRFGVGQNLYSAGDFELKPVDWNRPLNAFFSEVDMMDKSEVDSFLGNRGVGHYTQLVWGATTHVGCGYIAYNDKRYIQSYYACNYGKAGNYVNQKIYSVGPACSKCPAGSSCSTKYKGLCTKGGSGGGGGGGGGGSGGGG